MPVPVKTGFTPPPMPGMPAPMAPMGGMPPMGGGMPPAPAPAPNPFMPMPPAPLAGPQVPPPMPMQPVQGQGQQMVGSNAGRRRRFGDALEGMLGRNQGIGAAVPQQRPLPMPQMMPRQQMVAPGTPMMRTPSPRPMEMGGEVDIFGYEHGGPAGYPPIQHFENGAEVRKYDNVFGYGQAPEGQYYVKRDITYSPIDILNFIENNPDGYNPDLDLFRDGKINFTDLQMARGNVSSELAYDPATKTFLQESDYLPADILQYRDLLSNPEYKALSDREWDFVSGKDASGNIRFPGGLAGLGSKLDDYASSLGISRDQLGEYEPGYWKEDVLINMNLDKYIQDKMSDLGYNYALEELPDTFDYQLDGISSPRYSGRFSQLYYDDQKYDPVTKSFVPIYKEGGSKYDVKAAAALRDSLREQFEQDLYNYRDALFNYGNFSAATEAKESLREELEDLYQQKKQEYLDNYGLSGSGFDLRYYEPEYDPATQYLTGDDISGFNVLYTKPDYDPNTQYLTGNEYEGFQVVDIPVETITDTVTVDNTPAQPAYDPNTQKLVWDAATGSWVVEDIVTGPVIPEYDPTYQELIYDPATNTYSVRDIMPVEPVATITGSESGASSASNVATVSDDGIITPIEMGNFGTGTYTAAPVAPAEVNPIDYTQFTGNVGSTTGGYAVVDDTGTVTPGTYDQAALFGPRVTIPQSVSQYQTSDVVDNSGNVVRQLTTNYGPEMVAVSPIGVSKLPARPVEVDIFDWLSTPTYGTLYSSLYSDEAAGMRYGGEVPVPFMGGGSVPRQTDISGQPHMLAYINQDEEALLRSFGGSGISGPGGIPSYPPQGLVDAQGGSARGGWGGSQGFGNGPSGIGPSGYVSLDAIAAAATANDDDSGGKQSKSGSVNTSAKDADLSVGGSDKTVTADQLSSGVGTTTYDTDDGGSVTVATGSDIDAILSAASSDGGVSSVIDVIAPESVYDPPAPAYTDRRGNQFPTQAEADASDRAFAAQLALYASGKEGFSRFAGQARDLGIFDTSEEANRVAASAYPAFLENYNEGREINIFDPAPFTYTNISGIGGDTTGGGLGITPASVVDPSVSPTEDAMGAFLKGQNVLEGQPVISLDTPVSVDPDAGDPRGNQIVSPTGTGIGLQSDLQRGLGATPSQQFLDINDPIPGELSGVVYSALENLSLDDKEYLGELEGDYVVMKDGNILSTASGDLDYTLNELGRTRDDILFMGTKAQEKFGPEAQQFTGAIDEVQPVIDSTVKEIYTGNLSDDQRQAYLNSLNMTPEEIAAIADWQNKVYTGTDSVVPFPEASAQIKDYLEKSGLNLPDQRDPGSLNAGEAALIQEVLGRLTFDENGKLVAKDPNFIEKVLGQIGKNLTLGMLDINQMDKDQVQALFDAYKETGQFAYDDSNQVVGVIDADGNVVSYGPGYEMTESGVNRIDDADIFGEGDAGAAKNYTMGSDGAIVCNDEGYVYNSETDMCEPPAEEEKSDTVSSPILPIEPYRTFEDIMASITTPAPTIAPISTNIRPMQAGGMAGLNRAADNFLKALAG